MALRASPRLGGAVCLLPWVLERPALADGGEGVPLGLLDTASGAALLAACLIGAWLLALWSRRQRLAAKQAELALVIDATPLALSRCSKERRYVFVNRAAAALLGRRPDEVVGRRVDEVMGAQAFEQIRPHVDAVLGGERVEFEARIGYAAGPRFVRVSYVPERDARGTVTGWIATVADVTERREAEERLRESERTQRLLADISALVAGGGRNSSVGATRLVREVCERVAAELQVPRCGFSRLEPETGRVVVEAEASGGLPPLGGSPAAADVAARLAEDAAAGRTTAVADLACDPRTKDLYASLDEPAALRALLSAPLHRDGRWTASFWAGSGQPRAWSPAEVELVELVAGRSWQLLEQARVAAALLRSEARLSQELASTRRLQAIGARLVRGGDLQPLLTEIVAASAEIAGTDKGHIQFLDPRTGVLRIVAHQGLGERFLRHFAENGWGAIREAADARLERVILEDVERAPGVSGTTDLEVVLGDGIRAITSTPLVSRDGRLLGMLSNHFRQPHRPSPNELGFLDLLARMAADLVERKQAEEALHEADRRKDEFLATLSHELRNPLAPIRNAAHILRARASAEPEVRWAHAVIDRQLGHLVRLVDDLLEVGRITRGTIELRRGRAELSAVLASAVETVRPLVDEARQGLVLDLPSESLTLPGDGVRLTQVFANLLDNATKYTPAGGRISVAVRREPDFVEVSVADSGAGIPRDKLEQVFEMFVQVERPLERRQPGLGIGLHLVKRIVELHGGSVVAKSEGDGRGSELVVRLPLRDAAATAPAPLAAPRATSASRPQPPGRAQRVLVVDDNRDSVESLSRLLRLEGYETEVAYAGAEALSKARGFRPDVVLLDIGLPVMNGYDVCRALRREPDQGAVRIVALTGWGQERDRERATEAGFDAHLVKPVDPLALAALLNGEAAGR